MGMEYGVSSDRNTGRFEMWDVVDSRSASNASERSDSSTFSTHQYWNYLLIETKWQNVYICTPVSNRYLLPRSQNP